MSEQRTVAIRLKIPDNEARTALSALRRLGVDVARLERTAVWRFDDDGAAQDFLARIERNETLFNPNKHELHLREKSAPLPGEVWIEELESHDDVRRHLGGKGIAGIARARRFTGWRLFAQNGPAGAGIVRDAVEKLLGNPAIERAHTE